MYRKSIFCLFLSCSIIIPLIASAAPFRLTLERVEFSPGEEADWSPRGYFKKFTRHNGSWLEEEVGPIELQGTSTPKIYTLENSSPTSFPSLDVFATPTGQKSRDTFKTRLIAWVQNIKLTPQFFSFSGSLRHEEQSYSFQIDHPHPCYTAPTSICLQDVLGDINPDKLLLLLTRISVQSTQYNPNIVIDITKKLPLNYLSYPLPHTLKSAPSSQALIWVPTKGFIVSREEREIVYEAPLIAGVSGLCNTPSHPPSKEPSTRRITGSNSHTAYKNGLAGCVEEIIPQMTSLFEISSFVETALGDKDKEDNPASTTEGDSLSESFEVIPRLFSQSPRSITPEASYLEDVPTSLETGHAYTLLGQERRIDSPYLSSDGDSLYLTQTFQQDCCVPPEKKATHRLTHTSQLPFKVHIQSNDLRLKVPHILPPGLYKLAHGLWTKIDERYLPVTSYDNYKALPPQTDALTRSIASFEECHFPSIKEAFGFLGPIRDFIQPDPSALQDETLFKSYHSQIYTNGLLKTLSSIPEEHEHLITPLCLVVREDPTLKDLTLFSPESTYYDHDLLAAKHGVCWGGLHTNPQEYPSLHSFLTNSAYGHVYVAFPHSLVALPLFNPRADNKKHLSVSYGRVDKHSTEPISTILSSKDYKNVARLLRMNNFESFALTPMHDHEPDTVLTITPLAQALACNTTLRDFPLPRFIGLSNLTCLIREGLFFNTSIDSTRCSEICGDMPLFLLGELLEKNKCLKKMEIRFHHILDIESYNFIGRGLSSNTSLTALVLSDAGEKSCCEGRNPCTPRPLPGRSVPLPVDLAPFTQALISFSGTLQFRSHQYTLKEIFPKVKSERDKFGLLTIVG